MSDLDWFRDGLASGKLLICRCRDCGAYSEPRARRCPVCGSVELDPTATAGRARLVSWTRTPARAADPERTFVIAQLEEGPWWWGELLDAPGRPVVGDELELEIRPGLDGHPLPRFRPGSV